jgi:hypothetical protein
MNILDLVKKSLILFYLEFPVIIISTLLFLGVGLGNAGLLFLLTGHILIVPIAVALIHAVTQFIPFSTILYSDIAQLVPTAGIASGHRINVFPGYWISHFAFFSLYIFTNAFEVYRLPPSSPDPLNATKITNRKIRAASIMAFTVFTFLAFIGIRYWVTKSEHPLGMLLGIFTMGLLGVGWYYASSNSSIKTFDIFGIVQQMTTLTDNNATTLCVQQKTS